MVRLTASWSASQPPAASALRQMRSEAYLACGPDRRRVGRGPRFSICTAVGSTGEQPRRFATSSAT